MNFVPTADDLKYRREVNALVKQVEEATRLLTEMELKATAELIRVRREIAEIERTDK
jgi:hypothetical protein